MSCWVHLENPGPPGPVHSDLCTEIKHTHLVMADDGCSVCDIFQHVLKRSLPGATLLLKIKRHSCRVSYGLMMGTNIEIRAEMITQII